MVVSSPIPGRVISAIGKTGLSAPTWGLGRVDIFHGTSFDVIRLRGASTIATFHDVGYLRVPESYPPGAPDRFDNTVRSELGHIDHVITVSNHAKSDIASAYPIAPERITVVYSALADSISGLVPNGGGASLREAKESDCPYVLYVGEVGPRKNLQRLIAAFARVASSVPHNLVIAGPPSGVAGYRNVLESEARSGHVADRVHFSGLVTDTQLRALYETCDAFAFPSLYEGFGLPVLEAMSWGKPTLASAASALPEVAGDSALLVDPYSVDAIAQGLHAILTDPLTRQQLAASGPKRAALFTEENFVRGICGVYEKLG